MPAKPAAAKSTAKKAAAKPRRAAATAVAEKPVTIPPQVDDELGALEKAAGVS